jgi:hypothetical protein
VCSDDRHNKSVRRGTRTIRVCGLRFAGPKRSRHCLFICSVGVRNEFLVRIVGRRMFTDGGGGDTSGNLYSRNFASTAHEQDTRARFVRPAAEVNCPQTICSRPQRFFSVFARVCHPQNDATGLIL